MRSISMLKNLFRSPQVSLGYSNELKEVKRCGILRDSKEQAYEGGNSIMSDKTYKAIDLANYIISKCADDKQWITNLQLQKILFCIQRDSLQKRKKRLFWDTIEAWPFGPVVPVVYHELSYNGALPLFKPFNSAPLKLDPKDKSFIDPIIEEKSKMKPWDLVDETHKEGGAWDRVFKNGLGYKKEITTDLITECG